MAHEELMKTFPPDAEPVVFIPFYAHDNNGSWSVVAMPVHFIKFCGPNARENAIDLAGRLNEAFEGWLRRER